MNSLLQCIFESIESYELNGKRGPLEYHLRNCIVQFLCDKFNSYIETHGEELSPDIIELWLHIIEEK